MAEKEKMQRLRSFATVDFPTLRHRPSGPSSRRIPGSRETSSYRSAASPKKRLKGYTEVVSTLDRRTSQTGGDPPPPGCGFHSGLTPLPRSTLRLSRMMTRTALAEVIKTPSRVHQCRRASS
ncbi:hypothetical protein GWK47_015066 [Chionoecetes opilio]|uniref:Uncharacterized protein n=1 Tax=Chionoecetes opilio TaxID=41210 RepID=A0A8J4XSP5_CHIOP|nr:hypothetical protein GWK47_015066 [Chionoecetes opilio]